ncbi:hypothetical protein VP01_785g2 [Puccinia sorghi]|uniref:Wbp11/ELF5/Saf1 N-terminal domain-containing protein n=1 Tax=Puccinia sorghi TaxID=27349 RepID=A0A0L6UAZ9_9BASI|nr:hypothetical protein VP01_785g2 [Puccinia sorghi]
MSHGPRHTDCTPPPELHLNLFSFLMAKKTKSLNPADAFRKAQRQKEIKRNKLERKKAREDAHTKKDSTALQAEITQLERLSKPTPSELNRLKQARHDLSLIRKANEQNPTDPTVIIDPATGLPAVSSQAAQKQQHASSSIPPKSSSTMNWFGPDGKLLEPEKSFYYHPVFNPFGVPPPDDEIPLPEGSPPPKPVQPKPSLTVNRPRPAYPTLIQPEPFFPPPISLLPGLPPPPMIAGMGMMPFPLGPNGHPLPPPPIAKYHSLPPAPTSANLPAKPISTSTSSVPKGVTDGSTHKPSIHASAVLTAAPQLRDLKREATSFVPAAIRKKRKELDRRAGLAGLGDANRIQAAPSNQDPLHPHHPQLPEAAEPKQITTSLIATLKRDGVLPHSNAHKSLASSATPSATQEKDDYDKFVQSLGDVL